MGKLIRQPKKVMQQEEKRTELELTVDDVECLADGRPIPVNSKALWTKMTPEEHFGRLRQFDDIALIIATNCCSATLRCLTFFEHLFLLI